MVVVKKKAYGFEPGVCQRPNVESRFYEELSPTIRQNAGDNRASVAVIYEAKDSNGEEVL